MGLLTRALGWAYVLVAGWAIVFGVFAVVAGDLWLAAAHFAIPVPAAIYYYVSVVSA